MILCACVLTVGVSFTCLYMSMHQLSIRPLNDDFAWSVFHVSFTSLEVPLKYDRSAHES